MKTEKEGGKGLERAGRHVGLEADVVEGRTGKGGRRGQKQEGREEGRVTRSSRFPSFLSLFPALSLSLQPLPPKRIQRETSTTHNYAPPSSISQAGLLAKQSKGKETKIERDSRRAVVGEADEARLRPSAAETRSAVIGDGIVLSRRDEESL